ncbi:MAG: putative acyltransferase, partial [Phycisphaerales bacterium]|nr:putative acyltransferase [Phycisphaerales bacterium]
AVVAYRSMHRASYAIGRGIARHIGCMFVHHRIIHGQRLCRPGPYLMACTHIGHLEPVLLCASMARPVQWVARLEFYRRWWAAAVLRKVGAIPVDRFGVPVSTMRESLRRLANDQIVGIFPEGGRTHGPQQAIRGGPIKGGVCLLAERAGVPIVPVVMLGIDKMHAVQPFVPGNRTTICTIVGPAIWPSSLRDRVDRRERRKALTAELANAFIELNQEAERFAGGRA